MKVGATDHSEGYSVGSPAASFFFFSLILPNLGYLKGAIQLLNRCFLPLLLMATTMINQANTYDMMHFPIYLKDV